MAAQISQMVRPTGRTTTSPVRKLARRLPIRPRLRGAASFALVMARSTPVLASRD
jgi:hypothetical protein